MGEEIQAVCDQCKVKCSFNDASLAVSFLRRHANCNFTGCRVVLVDFLCPNRQKDYTVELAKEPA